jgi:hypothetical protein
MNSDFGFVLGTKTVDQSMTTIFDSALKIIFVLLAGLYLAFAFVVIRQISIMGKTLVTPFSPIVAVIGYLHFFFALMVFFFFLVL